MRDYLYIWLDKSSNCLITSGIEFSDFLNFFNSNTGLILLRHNYTGNVQLKQSLELVVPSELYNFAKDDIYSYGDFYWAEYSKDIHDCTTKDFSQDALEALLHFKNTGKPLSSTSLSTIGNHFIVSAHDDGWRTLIYFTDWPFTEQFLRLNISKFLDQSQTRDTIDLIKTSSNGIWITKGHFERTTMTMDIDYLMQQMTNDDIAYKAAELRLMLALGLETIPNIIDWSDKVILKNDIDIPPPILEISTGESKSKTEIMALLDTIGENVDIYAISKLCLHRFVSSLLQDIEQNKIDIFQAGTKVESVDEIEGLITTSGFATIYNEFAKELGLLTAGYSDKEKVTRFLKPILEDYIKNSVA